MSDKINVLISEEDVEKRIQEIGSAISKEYEGKMRTSDLCIKRWRIFCMRTCKKNQCTGNHGLYVRIQLWR